MDNLLNDNGNPNRRTLKKSVEICKIKECKEVANIGPMTIFKSTTNSSVQIPLNTLISDTALLYLLSSKGSLKDIYERINT